jgi:hypothetical protein
MVVAHLPGKSQALLLEDTRPAILALGVEVGTQEVERPEHGFRLTRHAGKRDRFFEQLTRTVCVALMHGQYAVSDGARTLP